MAKSRRVHHHIKTDGKRIENVQWWTMDAVSELELRLTDFANETEGFSPEMIDYIQSIYSGDHGKSKLRFVSKLVIALKNVKKKAVSVYALADVKCKNDTGEVFKITVKDSLAKGINKVEHGRVKFERDESTGQWNCTTIDKTDSAFQSSHDVTAYMIGDLKFLSMMLGKENFDGYWCYLCKLSHPEWQPEGYTEGELWTLDKLKEQAEKSKNLEGKMRMGVREEAYFDIPIDRYIWPVYTL